MVTKFTPEHLLQYLYKECSAAESAAIEAALETDWTLREKFEVLRKAALQLEKLQYSPRKESILNILQYAHTTAAPSC
ncbi:MAG: hypothetical protein FJX94_02885 [Bacteroidetes bacterium]|nr:hypothetical protein [Bacteroidota bacterium]